MPNKCQEFLNKSLFTFQVLLIEIGIFNIFRCYFFGANCSVPPGGHGCTAQLDRSTRGLAEKDRSLAIGLLGLDHWESKIVLLPALMIFANKCSLDVLGSFSAFLEPSSAGLRLDVCVCVTLGVTGIPSDLFFLFWYLQL